MVQVSFYHLLTTSLERVLPKLLEKIIGTNGRAVIIADGEERVAHLNTMLWTYSDTSFLPHGTKSDGFAENQPLWITSQDENPNGANFLVIVDNCVSQKISDYEKVLIIFNGKDDDAVKKARQNWKSYVSQGYQLVYYRQQENGSWAKEAST